MRSIRHLALLILLGLVLAAWDFFERIHVGRDDSLRAFDAPVVETLPVRLDPDAVRSQLVAWLPALAASAGVSVPDSDLSSAGWQLSLLGIFLNGPDEFAVLHAQPVGRGAAELLQVKEGETVRGFKVASIEPKVVRLELSGAQRELLLFEQGKVLPQRASTAGSAASADEVRAVTRVQGGSREERLAAMRERVQRAKEEAARKRMEREENAAPRPSSRTGSRIVVPPDPAATGGPKTSEAVQLKPGEEFKPPVDLPVVEDDGSKSEKKP